jgi:hypothetical protein
MLVGVKPVGTPSSEEVGIMFIASGFPDSEGVRSTKRDDSQVLSTGVIRLTSTPTNRSIVSYSILRCRLVWTGLSQMRSLFGLPL